VAVNFFGHAAVARWRAASPAMTLGAMLPDFATMCGGAIAGAGDGLPADVAAEIAGGIALHHATDAAFHRLPAFVALCRGASRRMQERGVGRGPARGAAHVIVELLLDGELTRDADARASYVAALALPNRDRAVAWREPAQALRYRALAARLAEHGVPVAYRDPDRVGARVARILSGYPRLAPQPAEIPAIVAEARVLAPRVADAAPALMDALAARLRASEPDSARHE
jgi:hypothetical protein